MKASAGTSDPRRQPQDAEFGAGRVLVDDTRKMGDPAGSIAVGQIWLLMSIGALVLFVLLRDRGDVWIAIPPLLLLAIVYILHYRRTFRPVADRLAAESPQLAYVHRRLLWLALSSTGLLAFILAMSISELFRRH